MDHAFEPHSRGLEDGGALRLGPPQTACHSERHYVNVLDLVGFLLGGTRASARSARPSGDMASRQWRRMVVAGVVPVVDHLLDDTDVAGR